MNMMNNNNDYPGEDAHSYNSARLRAFSLTTPGSLLLLCIILCGIGIAMILLGITFWSQEEGVRGIAIAGLLLLSIGLGVGAGGWWIHRRTKYSREHKMPVVTISLSQSFQHQNESLEGEDNIAADRSSTYYDPIDANSSYILDSTNSPVPHRSVRNRPIIGSPIEIHQHVQGPVVNIQIHGAAGEPPITTQRTHQQQQQHAAKASEHRNNSRHIVSKTSDDIAYWDKTEIQTKQNTWPRNGKRNSPTYQARTPAKDRHRSHQCSTPVSPPNQHNVNQYVDISEISSSFDQNSAIDVPDSDEDSPPPPLPYLERILETGLETITMK